MNQYFVRNKNTTRVQYCRESPCARATPPAGLAIYRSLKQFGYSFETQHRLIRARSAQLPGCAGCPPSAAAAASDGANPFPAAFPAAIPEPIPAAAAAVSVSPNVLLAAPKSASSCKT